MSGIFEQLIDALNRNTAALQGGQRDAPSPVVLPPANTAPPATVSAEQLTALIQPHVGNEAIKTALGVAMRGQGVDALPEAQAHQYGQLYTAFQAVLAAHGIGAGGAAPPAVSTSII